jgi:hypothetical protein
MSTKIASRKKKGKEFEKKIAKLFAETFNMEIPMDIRWAAGREIGSDVKLVSKQAIKKIGLAIECKNQRSLNIFKALEQSKKNAEKEGLIPVVCFHKSEKGNRETWITMPLEHYLELKEGNK